MSSARGMLIVDTISPTLDFLVVTADERVKAKMEDGAKEIEAYAQKNAPWSDRTGDARAGLTATVFEENGDIVLELAHSVDYGIWLELIQDGTFAIIMPTLEVLGPKVIQEAGGRLVVIEEVF